MAHITGWLQPYPGDSTKARCKVCNATLQAHMKTILGHASTKKHVQNIKSSGSKVQTQINERLRCALNDPTKVAELKLAVFISEHSSNIAVDHLGELVAQLDKKSATLQKIKLHRTKCSRLQKHVVAPSFAKTLRKEIGDHFYSLIIDESTNEANITCLGLGIRFFSAEKETIVDTFYRLVPLKDATANTIYKTVKSCLQEDNLSIAKLIGIGTDGASSMVGKNHSLFTLLKNDNPEITLVRCVCHSLHLAAAKACEVLPTILTFLVRETHSWFSSSPKRMHEYQELFKVLESSMPKKVPGMATTRWLARLAAVQVILEEWDALKLHFEMSASHERCYTARELGSAYGDPQNRLYLLFLRKVLKEVVRVNKVFQGQNVDVTKITEDLLDMYRSLLQIVVDSSYISKCPKQNLPTLNIQNYILPHTVINFGHEFNSYAESCSLHEEQINYVKKRCKEFTVELVNQVQVRLPDNVETLLMLKHFQPSNATSQCKNSIMPIACKYRSTFTDLDELETEWNKINFVQWPPACLGSTVSFWAEVNERRNSAGRAVELYALEVNRRLAEIARRKSLCTPPPLQHPPTQPHHAATPLPHAQPTPRLPPPYISFRTYTHTPTPPLYQPHPTPSYTLSPQPLSPSPTILIQPQPPSPTPSFTPTHISPDTIPIPTPSFTLLPLSRPPSPTHPTPDPIHPQPTPSPSTTLTSPLTLPQPTPSSLRPPPPRSPSPTQPVPNLIQPLFPPLLPTTYHHPISYLPLRPHIHPQPSLLLLPYPH
ncbi:hypothetical protein Pcinc_017987 [Petrolisthes cinctipes]|uniref:DUF4371 domain-containing protein n=1 Tax=Petrolisthes cinctipes TaxID=88211 RepID=A0AAE1KM52_PETCI|nr:hypothetical protein Pcinc_017987 [Petrolisthes cinctipes]